MKNGREERREGSKRRRKERRERGSKDGSGGGHVANRNGRGGVGDPSIGDRDDCAPKKTTVLMVTGRGDGDVSSGDDEPDGGGNDDERGAGDTICAGSDLVYTDGDENPKLIQTIRLSKRGLRPCV